MGRGTRYEKVGEAKDQVDREQLRPLEPVGSSVSSEFDINPACESPGRKKSRSVPR
jgi:hypothetical protein